MHDIGRLGVVIARSAYANEPGAEPIRRHGSEDRTAAFNPQNASGRKFFHGFPWSGFDYFGKRDRNRFHARAARIARRCGARLEAMVAQRMFPRKRERAIIPTTCTGIPTRKMSVRTT